MIFFLSAEYLNFGLTGWPELGPDLQRVHNCEQVLANLLESNIGGETLILQFFEVKDPWIGSLTYQDIPALQITDKLLNYNCNRVPFRPIRFTNGPLFYLKIGLDTGRVFAKCLIYDEFSRAE